jgi:hypothetical protein
MTKHQLIVMLHDRDTEWDIPVCVYGADGQIVSMTEIERDEDAGMVVSSIVTTWTYYNTGEVNVILITYYDENGVEKKHKRIKHYRDGRQPDDGA